MRTRIISIGLLGFAFLATAAAQTTAAEDKGQTTAKTKKATKTTEAKDTTPAATATTTNPVAAPAPSSTPVSPDQSAALNSVTGLLWFVIAVGLAVVVLLVVLLFLRIPGRLQRIENALAGMAGIRDTVNGLNAALGTPAANTTVAGNLQTLQNAVGTPPQGTTVVQTLGLAAQAAAVTQALTQLQTTLNQATQEIALVRGTSDTVLTQAWNRLAPGMPPPFAPRIDRISAPDANGLATIGGRNFAQDCRIWFGVRDAAPEPGATANRMTVRPPAGQSGTVDVCVQSTNGLVSSPTSFTYPAPAAGG